MTEKTKKNDAEESEKASAEECEQKDTGNWSEDQREKSYYYDDSYGYEVYNPDEDDEED